MALKVLVDEGMIENAAKQGGRLLEGFQSLRSNIVRDVRGRGLMIAVELHPEAGGARAYCQRLQAQGLLCKETHDHTIRVAPPTRCDSRSGRLDGRAVRDGAPPVAALPVDRPTSNLVSIDQDGTMATYNMLGARRLSFPGWWKRSRVVAKQKL